MRVNWLTYTNERDFDRVESTLWIRGYQLFPYLQERGIECIVNGPPDAAPIAVVLRWQDDRALDAARAVKSHGGRVIFDLCVNYFDETGLFPGGYGVTGEQVQQCRRMVGLADVVTCASANIVGRVCMEHACVKYLPDSIDLRHFNRTKSGVDFSCRRLRAVWAGTAVKAGDVCPVLPLLMRHRYRFIVVAERDPFASSLLRRLWMKALLDYRFVPWHYATFPETIIGGDVCISPRDLALPYNRGHSFFKIGVFMAEGVPVMASPVPSYLELLNDGRAGWVCRTHVEWDAALLDARCDRAKLRDRAAAASEVMKQYSTQRVAGDWANLIASLHR